MNVRMPDIIDVTNLEELARGSSPHTIHIKSPSNHVAVLDASSGDIVALCGAADHDTSIADAQAFAVAHRALELLRRALPSMHESLRAEVREVLTDANGGLKPNGGA